MFDIRCPGYRPPLEASVGNTHVPDLQTSTTVCQSYPWLLHKARQSSLISTDKVWTQLTIRSRGRNRNPGYQSEGVEREGKMGCQAEPEKIQRMRLNRQKDHMRDCACESKINTQSNAPMHLTPVDSALRRSPNYYAVATRQTGRIGKPTRVLRERLRKTKCRQYPLRLCGYQGPFTW